MTHDRAPTEIVDETEHAAAHEVALAVGLALILEQLETADRYGRISNAPRAQRIEPGVADLVIFREEPAAPVGTPGSTQNRRQDSR